jgi:flagellin
MTAETLGVNKEVISLNGTASTAETVTFDAFLAQGMTKAVMSLAAANTKIASGGAGVYTVTLNNATDGDIAFSTGTINAPADLDAVVTALNGISGLSDHGTFDNNSNALRFTAAAGGLHAAFDITSTGFTTDVNDAASPAVEGEQTAASSGLGTDGTTAVNDVYTLTVGTATFASAAATATTDYNTNKEIAAGLQTALTAANITDYTVATAGGYENTAITLTYAANGNQTETTYSIEKTTGDSNTSTADTDPTIADGTSQASDAITAIDAALATVASERATLGATQSQLESTVRNLANVAENTSAAAGRIMDTDYAAETANLTKAQILQQAATSILAQANAQPQSILALLR